MPIEIPISELIDLASMTKQTASVISDLKKIDETIMQVNPLIIKILNIDSYSKLKDAQKQTIKLNEDIADSFRRVNNILLENERLSKLNPQTASSIVKAANQVDQSLSTNVQSFDELNASYTLAKQNADELASKFGKESTEALEAAESAKILQRQVDKQGPGISVIQPQERPAAPVIESNGIAVQEPTAGATFKQLTALQELNDIYQQLKINAHEVAIEFGEDSKQAQFAADSVEKLKTYVAELNAIIEKGPKTISYQVKTTGKESVKKDTAETSADITVIRPAENIKPSNANDENGISVQQPVAEIQSLKELNTEYKQLQQNTKEAILNYGKESSEALTAADAENVLKTRIDELQVSYKQLSQRQKENADIPFTSNIDQLNAEQESLSSITGPVVNTDEIAATQKQLQVTRELNDERKNSLALFNQQAEDIQKLSVTENEYSSVLKKNVATYSEKNNQLQVNRTTQNELLSEISVNGETTEAQTSKLSTLRKEETSLIIANEELSSSLKTQINSFNSTDESILKLNAQVTDLLTNYEKLSATTVQTKVENSSASNVSSGNNSSSSSLNAEQETSSTKQLNDEKQKTVVIDNEIENSEKVDEVTTKLLTEAKDKLAFALSQTNVELQGYALQTSEANKAAKVEAEQALGLSGAYKRLTLDLISARDEAQNLGAEFGKDSVQFKTAAANVKLLDTEIKGIDSAVGTNQKKIEGYAGGLSKAFSGIFSYARQLAYIIPGIGIAGIFSAAIDGITELISSLKLFDSESEETKRHQAELGIAVSGASSEFIKASSNVLKLQADVQLAKDGFIKKSEVVKEYNTTLGDAIGKVNSLDEVEKALADHSEDYVHAIFLRAIANQALEESSKKAFEAEGKRLQAPTDFLTGYEKTINVLTQFGNKVGQVVNTVTDGITNIKDAPVPYTGIVEQVQTINDSLKDSKSSFEIFQDYLKQAEDFAKTHGIKLDSFIDLKNKIKIEDVFAVLKDALAHQIKDLQDFVDKGGILFHERYAAAKEESDLEIKLSDLTAQSEIKAGKNRVLAEQQNAERIEDINKKLAANVEKINFDRNSNPFPDPPIATPKEYYEKRLADLKKYHDKGLISEREFQQQFNAIQSKLFDLMPADQQVQQQLAKQREVNDQLTSLIEKAGQDRANIIAKNLADEQAKLSSDYANNLISREDFEKAQKDLVIRYGKESLDVLIHIKEQELLLQQQTDPNSDKVKALLAEIAKLKKQLKDLGVDIKDGNLSDLSKTFDQITEAAAHLTAALSTLGNIGYDNQKAALEELGAQQDQNYEHEVSNINNSTLAAEDKSNKLIALDATHQAQQEQNSRKQKELDNQKAQFDKEAAIANIVLNTASAIIKALADPGGFAGVALSIAIGIEGAAQLGAAIATKVPSYKTYTDYHPGGPAMIFDRPDKSPEVLVLPTGEKMAGNDPTLVWDLPAGSKVLPIGSMNPTLMPDIEMQNFSTKKAMDRILNSSYVKRGEQSQTIDYNKLGAAIAKAMGNQKRPVVKNVISNRQAKNIENSIILRQMMDKHRYGNSKK